jgi:hypothetical protein
MTLLGVVDNLIHRIESHQNTDQPSEDSDIKVRTGNPELDEMSDDFAELENLDYTLKDGWYVLFPFSLSFPTPFYHALPRLLDLGL